MKRAREYHAARRMSQVQELHVLKEQSSLFDAHRTTLAAEEELDRRAQACGAAEQAVTHLLQEPTLCPIRYGLLGAALLATEADKRDSANRLENAETSESTQRSRWKRSRDQADWLHRETHKLRKRVVRDADDKRGADALDILLHRRNRP